MDHRHLSLWKSGTFAYELLVFVKVHFSWLEIYLQNGLYAAAEHDEVVRSEQQRRSYYKIPR